eukprot:gnl/Dysnectes_brevis/7050_a11468_217.p1 GENE.gnl/Dysnectes_brevis/7050_a11468_217~~gnl/Dysnectes_brevis/7050_a11468_217.p1  ORF type:complete len:1953 (+),score=399.80 gnl/Dysnectes_brevis/7050_a11468_217:192-5861(+)
MTKHAKFTLDSSPSTHTETSVSFSHTVRRHDQDGELLSYCKERLCNPRSEKDPEILNTICRITPLTSSRTPSMHHRHRSSSISGHSSPALQPPHHSSGISLQSSLRQHISYQKCIISNELFETFSLLEELSSDRYPSLAALVPKGYQTLLSRMEKHLIRQREEAAKHDTNPPKLQHSQQPHIFNHPAKMVFDSLCRKLAKISHDIHKSIQISVFRASSRAGSIGPLLTPLAISFSIFISTGGVVDEATEIKLTNIWVTLAHLGFVQPGFYSSEWDYAVQSLASVTPPLTRLTRFASRAETTLPSGDITYLRKQLFDELSLVDIHPDIMPYLHSAHCMRATPLHTLAGILEALPIGYISGIYAAACLERLRLTDNSACAAKQQQQQQQQQALNNIRDASRVVAYVPPLLPVSALGAVWKVSNSIARLPSDFGLFVKEKDTPEVRAVLELVHSTVVRWVITCQPFSDPTTLINIAVKRHECESGPLCSGDAAHLTSVVIDNLVRIVLKNRPTLALHPKAAPLFARGLQGIRNAAFASAAIDYNASVASSAGVGQHQRHSESTRCYLHAISRIPAWGHASLVSTLLVHHSSMSIDTPYSVSTLYPMLAGLASALSQLEAERRQRPVRIDYPGVFSQPTTSSSSSSSSEGVLSLTRLAEYYPCWLHEAHGYLALSGKGNACLDGRIRILRTASGLSLGGKTAVASGCSGSSVLVDNVVKEYLDLIELVFEDIESISEKTELEAKFAHLRGIVLDAWFIDSDVARQVLINIDSFIFKCLHTVFHHLPSGRPFQPTLSVSLNDMLQARPGVEPQQTSSDHTETSSSVLISYLLQWIYERIRIESSGFQRHLADSCSSLCDRSRSSASLFASSFIVSVHNLDLSKPLGLSEGLSLALLLQKVTILLNTPTQPAESTLAASVSSRLVSEASSLSRRVLLTLFHHRLLEKTVAQNHRLELLKAYYLLCELQKVLTTASHNTPSTAAHDIASRKLSTRRQSLSSHSVGTSYVVPIPISSRRTNTRKTVAGEVSVSGTHHGGLTTASLTGSVCGTVGSLSDAKLAYLERDVILAFISLDLDLSRAYLGHLPPNVAALGRNPASSSSVTSHPPLDFHPSHSLFLAVPTYSELLKKVVTLMSAVPLTVVSNCGSTALFRGWVVSVLSIRIPQLQMVTRPPVMSASTATATTSAAGLTSAGPFDLFLDDPLLFTNRPSLLPHWLLGQTGLGSHSMEPYIEMLQLQQQQQHAAEEAEAESVVADDPLTASSLDAPSAQLPPSYHPLFRTHLYPFLTPTQAAAVITSRACAYYTRVRVHAMSSLLARERDQQQEQEHMFVGASLFPYLPQLVLALSLDMASPFTALLTDTDVDSVNNTGLVVWNALLEMASQSPIFSLYLQLHLQATFETSITATRPRQQYVPAVRKYCSQTLRVHSPADVDSRHLPLMHPMSIALLSNSILTRLTRGVDKQVPAAPGGGHSTVSLTVESLNSARQKREDRLPVIAFCLYQHIRLGPHRTWLKRQVGFYDAISRLSVPLTSVQPEERNTRLNADLEALSQSIALDSIHPPASTGLAVDTTLDEDTPGDHPDDGILLLTDPRRRVRGVVLGSGRVMKSHAKLPIRLAFRTSAAHTNPGAGEDSSLRTDGVIFKVGDDVRQDQLALLTISAMRSALRPLRLWLSPYLMLPTRGTDGILEVLANSRSRDEIGGVVDSRSPLFAYFSHHFGPPGSPGFQAAQRNFLLSTAAYSIVTYLLAFKDRHNGNIMLNPYGHVIHIDFGFMLDIAPGGSFSFERAPFKLTQEMFDLLGGTTEAPSFQVFRKLYQQAFLVARLHASEMIYLVQSMQHSKLPGYRPATMQNLTSRFSRGVSSMEAVRLAGDHIHQSLNNVGTSVYDRFQAWQNEITF